jgi:DNA-binding transcriptional LysR family regulator
VETVSLRDDPLVLVAAPGSSMAKAGKARLEEVAVQPLILFDRGSSDWTLSLGLFRRAGLVPNVVLEVESIEAAKRMVERGIGIAFLPQLAVVREIRRGQLIAIDLRDAEALSRSLDLIHPRQRPLSAEALALLKTLRAAVGEVTPAPVRRGPARPRGGRARASRA